ncbi:hypothetical protein [Endozoicomonas sp. ALB032]|uniref:hypothetical protein n=1 Tax=Endozoicomonas sp. ALB032 TaxID=3403082 RepID=UPI003BB5F860
MSLSVISQSKPLTRHFVVELEQNADFPNRDFSIKLDLRMLSGNPSDNIDSDGYAEPGSSPDDKRHKPYSYRVKTILIESISWRWLCATNLLVACELFLTIQNSPLDSLPCSWPPLATAIAVGWLLKSYFNPDSPVFNSIEQKEACQNHLFQNHLFVITTTMPGSEHAPQQGQPSTSSGQQIPQATTYIKGYFTRLLNSDSGNNNEGPEQYLHTLGLNCYLYPCDGVCRFRQSSNPSESGALVCEESSTNNTEETPEQISCPHLANTQCYSCNSSDGAALNSVVSGEADATCLASKVTCNVLVLGEDDHLRQCGSVCKNVRALSSHKSSIHTGQKTCDLTVPGESGQLWPCGKTFKNAQILSAHKREAHTGQQTCDLTVLGEDNQLRPCGKIFKNTRSLSFHKTSFHTGQKTCSLTVPGGDGQLRRCGRVFKNSQVLSNHKRRTHSVQQTCNLTALGQDGQLRPCRKVLKNTRAMLDHKSKIHSGQKTCEVIVVGEDGQQRPCGRVCRHITALANHKMRDHSGQKTCSETVVHEDGQQRTCGKVCKNAQDLSNHKRIHRKRKPVDVN